MSILIRSSKNISPHKYRYFSNIVSELGTLAAYKSAIKDNNKIAIDFTASWCPPCKIIGPKFVKMAEEFPGIKFFKLDVDANADAAQDAKIRAMPTFKFYHNREKVDELVGASEDELKKKLDDLNDLQLQ